MVNIAVGKPGRQTTEEEMVQLFRNGQHDRLSDRLPKAIEMFPTSPVLWSIAGGLCVKRERWKGAEKAFDTVVKLTPGNPSSHNNLGNALQKQGAIEAAIESYLNAVKLKPDYASAQKNLGAALMEQGELAAAIVSYTSYLQLVPDDMATRAQLLFLQAMVCDWDAREENSTVLERIGLEGGAIAPFTALALEDNVAKQLQRSKVWAKEQYEGASFAFAKPAKDRPERLKIGYFSSDFYDHATLFLMSGLFREHDRDRFEIHAYCYSGVCEGSERAALMVGVDGFHGVHDMSPAEIAGLARSHELDIAIDLKGYTRQGRSEIFSFRAAPIQINYLGYPGSMGTDFMDYLVADKALIPENLRSGYSEKIIFLPNTYQPNDDTRVISPTPTTRHEYGLPEEGFVFCCHNNPYKIGPHEFDVWMRLLGKVPGSVLWLLGSNKWAETNLRQEAKARGIDPDRLVFADHVGQADHLARLAHADLFLDTFAVNAHTTTSDALWTGLPVVTLTGQQFAARVATSLLRAANLGSMACGTVQAYEDLALDLARNPEKLRSLRQGLIDSIPSVPLFDTRRYARAFEVGLDLAHERYRAGLAADDIEVPQAD